MEPAYVKGCGVVTAWRVDETITADDGKKHSVVPIERKKERRREKKTQCKTKKIKEK
jgi:hypothetical protein